MNRPPQTQITERILDLLRQRPGLKAAEIAAALELQKSAVNQALYGVLADQVVQDRAYRWSVAKPAAGAGDGSRTWGEGTRGPLAQLCRYYLDCLAHDAEQGCSVFAAGNSGAFDYAPLAELPELRSLGTWARPLDDEAQRLVQRGRGDRTATLYVGYPTLLRFHRTAKWEGFMVEPLLLYPIEPGENGGWQVADDLPSFNFKALRSLGDGGNVLDDAVALSEELGLAGSEEPPALEEIARRLQSLRPDWPWLQDPVLEERKIEPAIAKLDAAGIYNYAVLISGERPTFTQGLETELKELSRLPADRLSGTALGQWLLGLPEVTQDAGDEPLLEVVSLNTEQRVAVRSALSSPLTVITGPPGTGKSQVVSALLANCAFRGQKVLFASKNNKAVDVVEQRINGLASRPTLIRLGSRQYESRLAEFLMGLLSATAMPEDESEYQSALETQKRLASEAAALDRLAERIVELRNQVDRAEAGIEVWRNVFGESLGPVGALDVSRLRQTIAALEQSARAADRRQAGILQKLFWSAMRAGRFEALNRRAREADVVDAARALRVALPPEATVDGDVEPLVEVVRQAAERLRAVEEVQQYFAALRMLETQPSLAQLARDYADVERRLAQNALTLWQSWARLQPARLKREDRQLLGRYHTVLQVVLDSTRGGGLIPGGSWRQYREIVPRVSHLIPCWAVTSLSANGKVPFEPGMFDLLIVDEASQCDIASVVPLLYRAKRVAVIGDPKQLAHISKLSPRQDAQVQQKQGLPDELMQWTYSVNSLFALASTQAGGEAFVTLRDHHRSHADIIEFSNRQFYEGRLRVATRYDRLRRVDAQGPALKWLNVQGQAKRPPSGSVLNDAEAREVVALLRRLVMERGYAGSVGAVSPFRAQCNRIRDLVNEDRELSDRLARQDFIAETAHQFQGDERDVIVFSPVVARGVAEGSLAFLRKNGNLFNVAITRARAALYVVGDKQAALESGVDYLASFVRYADEVQQQERAIEETANNVVLGPEFPVVARPELVSDWERVLYRALYAAGVRAIPQYSVEKYVLDFAVLDGERRLNIEVDGEQYHRAWNGELLRRDRLRNQRMMELGWEVRRYWVYQVRDELERCVQEIKAWADGGEFPRDQ
jgi:very-short-patch-repair endonuclease